MRDFKELDVWKESHKIVLEIYTQTKGFPKEEQFGLISQMRRSAQSIPTNIVEGCGRSSEKDFLRFCHISMGSASELEYQLILSYDLKYINPSDFERLSSQLITLKKRLNAFMQYLKSQKPNNPKA